MRCKGSKIEDDVLLLGSLTSINKGRDPTYKAENLLNGPFVSHGIVLIGKDNLLTRNTQLHGSVDVFHHAVLIFNLGNQLHRIKCNTETKIE